MIRRIAIAAALAVSLALIGTTGVSTASASTTAGASLPNPVTNIVIYDGVHAAPQGPAGPLPYGWTLSTVPSTITTVNFGKLVEDTSLVWPGGNHGGTWWFSTHEAILHVFDWNQNGQVVQAQSLTTFLNQYDTAHWMAVPSLGPGVVAPTCLQWSVGPNLYYVVLNTTKTPYNWVKATPGCVPAQ